VPDHAPERRLFPRVAVKAPVFARRISQDRALAGGAELDGMLLDASRGGVAFEARQRVSRGELVELAVVDRNGAGLRTFARVIACEPHPDNEFLVRCAFVEPTPDASWIASLQASGMTA
jgi:hypothetical protein